MPTENPPDQSGWTERERAQYRAETGVCAGCHVLFDPYGLSLDVFDAIGRYRTEDPDGRPIDPSVTLPAPFTGTEVSGPAEMAALLAESEEFRRCVAMNFMNFALGDISQGSASAPLPHSPAASCVVRDVVRDFDSSGDPSFSGLVTAIARSPVLRTRKGSE